MMVVVRCSPWSGVQTRQADERVVCARALLRLCGQFEPCGVQVAAPRRRSARSSSPMDSSSPRSSLMYPMLGRNSTVASLVSAGANRPTHAAAAWAVGSAESGTAARPGGGAAASKSKLSGAVALCWCREQARPDAHRPRRPVWRAVILPGQQIQHACGRGAHAASHRPIRPLEGREATHELVGKRRDVRPINDWVPSPHVPEAVGACRVGAAEYGESRLFTLGGLKARCIPPVTGFARWQRRRERR